MPISVQWGNEEDTILHYIIADEWSLDEAWHILETKVAPMHQQADYVTDSIIEFRQPCHLPQGILNFWRRAYSWMQEHHRASSFIVVVQAPPAVKGIADTLRTLRVPIMRLVVFVDSLEEARHKIAEHRNQTPRLRVNN